MYNQNEQAAGREIGWDEEITLEYKEFVLLPEGDYDFTVTGFERGRHNGSKKLPACSKAVINLSIDSPNGTAIIKHNLFLHTSTLGLLTSFLVSIGIAQGSETLRINWNDIVGRSGRAKINTRRFTNNNGVEIELNQIQKFYKQETTNNSSKGWQEGAF